MKYCNQLRLLCCSHERVHFQNKSFHTDCRQITSYFRNAKVGHVTSRCVAQVKSVCWKHDVKHQADRFITDSAEQLLDASLRLSGHLCITD